MGSVWPRDGGPAGHGAEARRRFHLLLVQRRITLKYLLGRSEMGLLPAPGEGFMGYVPLDPKLETHGK
jgi:hypothetical protein